MSHSVSVTKTTTMTSTTAIVLNVGLLKTVDGALKLLQLILGAVCLGLVAYYSEIGHNVTSLFSEMLIFYLTVFAFLMTTFLLLASAICSIMSATILPKTVFHFLYHVFAVIFYFSASLALLVRVQKLPRGFHPVNGVNSYLKGLLAASILGLFNTALYALGAFFSFRTYRSG